MSRIDQLISQYCPAGVPMVRLGEVCEILDSKRKPISKSKRNEGQYPYYGANGIQDYVDGYLFDGDYLLIGEDGSVITPSGQPILNWATGKFWVNNHAHIIKELNGVSNPRYIFHALHLADITDLVHGVPPKLNQENLRSISIPLPPLPVQEEIVRILDAMSDLVSNLNAEISARQKQYEHAREKLLTFGKEVERKTLGEIFQIRGGYTPSTNNPDFWTEEGGFPWFKMEDIRDKGRFLSESYSHITTAAIKSNGLFPAGTIVFATSATIGEHAMLMVPALTNQRFTALIPKDDTINMKYIFYYGFIIDKWCKENTIQGSFAGVNMVGFRNYPIPLPPLSVQQSIVERLDKMESLIQNLQAERTLRQKQYEYYREKLLTFERT